MLKYLLEKLIMDLDNILKLMLEATSCASKKIMEIYKSNFHINFKEDNSPVTSADIESNKIITSYLSNTNIKILSEEITDDFSRLNEEKLFILDPLDGTQDFVSCRYSKPKLSKWSMDFDAKKEERPEVHFDKTRFQSVCFAMPKQRWNILKAGFFGAVHTLKSHKTLLICFFEAISVYLYDFELRYE